MDYDPYSAYSNKNVQLQIVLYTAPHNQNIKSVRIPVPLTYLYKTFLYFCAFHERNTRDIYAAK
jgi:hypothetical protein